MKNSMESLQIDLNSQAKNYKEVRIIELLNHPLVINFLKENHLDSSIVDKYFSSFDRWIKVASNDPSMANYQREGYEMTLVFRNESVDFVYIQSPEEAKRQKELAHLKAYLINHCPTPMSKASFKSLDLSQEPDSYYVIVAKMLDIKETGIYLHGSIGSGKTYLMACLANDYARSGKTVSFIRLGELLSELKGLFDDEEALNSRLQALRISDLLIIDDIGSENVTNWGRDDILFNALNHRMENQLLTCFTSNLSLKELKEFYLKQQYGVVDENKVDRLMERILTLAKPLYLHGPSRRK